MVDKKNKRSPGRPSLNKQGPLTNAEKQRRYRQAQKEKVQVKIYLEAKLHARLKRLAKRSQITLAELIYLALEKLK